MRRLRCANRTYVLESLAQLDAHDATSLSIAFIEPQLSSNAKVPSNTAAFVAQLREGSEEHSEKDANSLMRSGVALMQQVSETLNKAALKRSQFRLWLQICA